MNLSTSQRWRQTAYLFRDDRDLARLCGRAALWAPLVASSLRVRGFSSTLAWIDGLVATDEARAGVTIEQTERAVRWAFRAQPWLQGRCLQRSLVQLALLRRVGANARLVIGVRRPTDADGAIDAHAWLETADDLSNTKVRFVARNGATEGWNVQDGLPR